MRCLLISRVQTRINFFDAKSLHYKVRKRNLHVFAFHLAYLINILSFSIHFARHSTIQKTYNRAVITNEPPFHIVTAPISRSAKEHQARMTSTTDRALSVDVTSRFFNNFSIILSNYACKIWSNNPGDKLTSVLWTVAIIIRREVGRLKNEPYVEKLQMLNGSACNHWVSWNN